MNFKTFKEKYEHKPVEEYPNKVSEDPMVSVCVQTYQHASYIKECLDGILMQETDFPFEILLGEDGSKDGTREICLEYAKKYPDKIRLFLHHRENNIKIGGNPTGRFNFLYNLYIAHGKYIALCEGDDYWTDPLKLQKQADFLEENLEYTGVYTNFKKCDEEGVTIKERMLGKDQPIYFDKLSVFGQYSSQTLTVLYKNIPEVTEQVLKFTDHLNADRVLAVFMAQQGKIRFMDFVSGSYRWGSGIHSTLKINKKKKERLRLYKAFKKYFNKDNDIIKTINKRMDQLYISQINTDLLHGKMRRAIRYNKIRREETQKYLGVRCFLFLFFNHLRTVVKLNFSG